MKTNRLVMLTAGVIALAGCGQKGPLYLPEEARDIVTRPAATPPAEPKSAPGETTGNSNTPATVDSPVQSPPAPEVTAPQSTPPAKDAKDGNKKKNPPPQN